jgi:hypothetical protein
VIAPNTIERRPNDGHQQQKDTRRDGGISRPERGETGHRAQRPARHAASLGPINLGPPDQLAYLAGIAALTALEIIEWPIALVIAAGHLLAEQRRSNTHAPFGEALEQA